MALTRPRYSQIPDTDWKQSVRVATTADVGNVMLAVMPSTVDGVTLNFYDRVLLRSQANAAQNGIYYVKAVGTGSNGIWERTKDASSGGALGAVTPSIVTMVEEGTINKNRTFKLTTTGNIDLGTTDLSFGVQAAEPAGSTGQLQFANVNNVIGGATTTSYDYTTGNLTLTGNVNTTLLYQNGKRVPQVFTSVTPPDSPAVGDQWYQIGTDIVYEWLQDGATAYWIDISGATIANINPITGESVGSLTVNGGNESTSPTTGALQVVGGTGITGNLNVGGSITFGGGQLGSDLVVNSTAPSTSETTGAIRIASPGGLGVGGNIWVGGTFVANSRIPSTSISTGAIILPGAGGLGVGGNVNIGQNLNVAGTVTGGGVRQTISSGAPSNPTVGDQWYQLGTDILYQYVSDGTGSYWVDVAGATVANISQQTNTVNDIHLVSGTPSTGPDSGALIVSGGVGIQGNLNLDGGFNITSGNLVANQNVTSTDTTTGAIVVTGQGGVGVGGNVNIGGNLRVAQSVSFLQNVIISANLVAGGTYFSAGGLSVTNGNMVATGSSAQIGGLTITNGAISGLTSLGVTGSTTIGADLAVTGNITGGGLRKYAQVSKPANATPGDVWYKTDTDVYYTYVNDGTASYWIDYTSATVANITAQPNQTLTDIVIVSGTPSTNTTSGALQVQGGVGVTGNINAGNIAIATVTADNFTYANGVSILVGNEGTYSNANVTAYLAASTISIGGNLTAGGTYFSAGGLSVTAGNIVATGAKAVIGGLTIENGGISSLASLNVTGSGTLGGDFAVTGNITGGGLRKYTQVGAPTNPVVGDLWYKTDTDVMYQYISDGTNKFWVDYTSATVSNASPTSPQSLQDLQIVSGTPSTGSGTGALQVTGGAAVTGNLFSGNLSTTTVAASNFTYANGVSILAGNEGTYSNANVTAYLTARSITLADGNITAPGGYLSAGGFTATAGNIRTTSANIGGLIIENGGIGQLASLGVVGAATIGGDVAITGNITAGGLRKYAQVGAPANPVVGDVWYKTDTDVYYQYITDGTKNIWVDYSSATVSNASPTTSQSLQDLQIVSGTPSTSTSTGALVVQGGIGASGNVFVGNVSTSTVAASNFTYANGVSILAGNEGTYSNANVTAYLTARTTTINDGYLSTAGMTVTAGNLKTTSANIGGVIVEAGGISQLASIGVLGAATIGGDLAVTGNVTGGGLRKYAQVGAPTSPVVGDVWYKTDTDVYYQYITDGTKNIWVDYSSATVSNASPTQPQSLQDLTIVSGTQSTSTSTGALVVQGGAGISGNVFTGNLSTSTVTASNFTYANGVSILLGNEGTYSNANVTAYLTSLNVTIADGNITATGGYLSAGGFTATAGNIRTTSANIGGVIIESGGIGSLASLAVIGAGTVGGDFAITGNITAGGLRKYAQVGAPANPVVGDVWYKTDTDVFYQYVNDGTNKYWIDYTSATVSNASPTSPQSLQDLQIVSGTESTNTTSGALQVTGGAGISGNINAGNVTTGTLTATTVNSSGVVVGTGFTYANGVSILVGNEGTYSNSNVTAYLTARTTTINDGYLSTAGMTVTAGNLKTTSANIGGLIIENAGIGSLASLGVVGAATIGGDLAVTGNVTGGGLRKYAQTSAPANPIVGDVWYKTDTDVYYTYINDGTNKYWVDYIGATVSNATITSSQIAYDIVVTTDTQSTSTTTGAIRVQGGIGLIGNIYTTGIADFGGNLTAGNILSNNNLQTTTLQVTSDANVTGNLAVNKITASGNITSAGQYFSAAGLSVTNGNITTTGTTATIAGLQITNGALPTLPTLGVTGLATFGANVDVTGSVNVTGNIMGGGLRKYAQVGAPSNPVVGDVWYKTDTDVYYQYINDGTSKYWIDYSSATVSNASPTSLQSIQDLAVVGGTPSTGTTTGAITVLGGIGLTGNINVGGAASIAGNVSVGNLASNGVVSGTGFTYANGVSILVGNEGTYSNANVTAYLTARTTTINDGYLSTAGMTVTAGNLKTASANIGGVIIEAGGIGSLASLNVIGGATIGGDVTITGNITGGGIRKTTSISAPTSPVVGDQWYKTDTDTLYQYINDGTTNYWVDVAGATVSNARTSGDQISYDIVVTTDTQSTSPTTGAVRVQGGIGLIGNIYMTGIADIGGNLRAGNILANNNLQTTTLQVIGDSNLNKLTATGNITSAGTYFSAAGLSVTNGNVVATGTSATIGGLVITNGGLPSLPSLGVLGAATFGANVDITGNVNVTRDIIASGNIVAGGVRKYAQISKPTNAVPGDVWYKTDTDVYYTYINDGTNSYWVDYVGATVSNAAVDNSTNQDFTIASGTLSTDSSTGALVVVGGVGVTGDINTTGDFTIDGTFTACTAVSAGYLNVADGIDSYGNVVIHGPGTANYTVQVRSSDAADDVLGIKTSVAGGGFAIDSLNNELIGATPLGINANTFSVGIKNALGTTVQADALKVDTAGNTSIAKTLSVGQHVNVTGNLSGSTASFTKVIATTANFTTLNLSGTLTVPTLNVTTSIDAPGIRKYAQVSAPTSPAAGDVWYKTDTDVYYTYVNDGTGSYWIDYVGATVSNAAVSASTNNDYRIASGTASTNTDTGALTVVGGFGITGDINAGGNVSAQGQLRAVSGVQSTSTTTGAVVVTGGVGISANVNIGGALATDSFSVASVTNLAGNLYGTNMSLTGRADIAGAAIVGGNLDVTGRVTGGGIRKTTSISAPTSPVVGDLWYKTDTDVLYQYINDGTSNYWIDYVGATVSNAAVTAGTASDYAFTSGTQSTSPTTGAIVVSGGVGISGDLFSTGFADFGGNVTVNNLNANVNVQTNTLAVSGSGAVVGNLTTGNLATGIATIARADIAGALTVGGDVTITGNIIAGGIRKTQSTNPPANPTVGDLWYKTDTDVYYQYTSDGVNKYWIDYVGATVSNAAVQNSVNNDFRIASGTESTNTDTGALTVVGGVGITGNINAGSIIATGFYSDNFSFANGKTLADRITGTFSNTNVAAYLTGSITTGNITAGNIATTDITARDITARNVTLSGNITGGGLRKYAQTSAPTNPILGDVWYKTDTDVYYQYINDGASNFWVDYVGPTVSNAAVDNSTNVDFTVASGTESTSPTTGALRVVGGVGVTGNINASNNLVIGDNLTVNGTTTLHGTTATTLDVSGPATVGTTLVVTGNITGGSARLAGGGFVAEYGNVTATGNLVASGSYLSAGGISATSGVLSVGNIISNGTRAVVGGLTIENGAFGSVASLAVIAGATFGGDVAVTGNITAGGLRKYAQVSAPTTPVVGDVWYKTDTDVYYQYVNDGTSNYWIDYSSATVSNASPTSPQSLQDLQIVSGTPSTSTTSGALQVTGGAGISGNITAGNVVTSQVSADKFTYANGVSIFDGYYQDTYSNANVTAYLTARTTTISDGYLSTAGMTVTAGNLKTTSANIGGLIIENSGISSLASLGVVGSATIGADLAVTGNVTGGGLRKYAQDNAPTNPVVGDVWYKTDTDVYYQYINDGTSKYWVDYVGATVSNASVTSSQISYDIVVTTDTQSTSTTTGAIRVQGGIGLIGNIYTTGIADFGGNLTAGNVTANNNVQAKTLAVTQDATIGGSATIDGTLDVTGALTSATLATGNVTVGNISGYGFTTNAGNLVATGSYLSAGGLSVTAGAMTAISLATSGNIVSQGTYAKVGGLEINNGGLPNLNSLGVIGSATIGGDLTITGNVTGGGLRKYAQTSAPANPVLGDVWYKTDTDVYYQYISDGSTNVWVDFVSATVANITAANSQYGTDVGFVSGTVSTDQTNGAVTVIGGVGVTGNINLTGRVTALDTITGQRIVSNTSITGSTLTVSGDTSVGNLTAGNITGYGFTTNNGNVTASGVLTVGGLSQVPGNLSATGSYFSAGGLSVTAGNITGYGFTTSNGNLITTGSKAVVGGLTIENGGFSNLSSLGVIGSVNVGGDVTITGNVIGGGLRKTQSTTPPSNPVQGDIWYKTDEDIYYQYISDGTSSFWVDYTSAAVANVTISAETVGDLVIVSGTPSTDPTNGALVVAGGVGVTGDVNISSNVTVGNVIANKVYSTGVLASSFTYPNGASILDGYYFGTYSNANVGGYLTAQGIGTAGGNLTATGSYFSAGGLSATAGEMTATSLSTTGNIISQGTYAKVGGLEIINGGFGSLASIGVIGGATIGGDVAITGNITAGGLRKYAQTSAPANPVVGDVWYKTDTDVYYQYITDGAQNVWVDFVSATVANITAANSQYGTDVGFVSGTLSTSPQSGAVQVIGGVGVTGNINTTGKVTAQNTITGQAIVSNSIISGTTLLLSGEASINGGLTTDNITGSNLNLLGNIFALGNITGFGFNATNGNLTASGSYFSAGGLSSLNGAITGTGFSIVGGNVITSGAKAVVGGLTIENGAFGSVASLGVIGSATIGGDVNITGNISGGGVRKYAQTSAPTNPIAGDVWYKTDADIYYTYVNDGTSTYWIDYTSAAIANITVANSQYGSDVGFVSGTLSTDQTTGAVVVIGGVGVTGNINAIGKGTFSDTLTGGSIVSNSSITGATLSIAGTSSVGDLTAGNLTVGNITGYGFSTNNGNVVATGKLTVGGLSVVPGNLSATGSYLSVNGFTALNGNITATGTTATIGGLTIANGGFGSIASLDVIGSATIGGDVAITGNITAGGIRKTTSITAPANPTVGDQWYKTDTDILYQFMDDGTTQYWVDFASATVANITSNFDGLGDFTTIGNVIGNGIVSDNYYYANGVSFVTTTVANTQNIVANITNGFDLGLDLTKTGVVSGNYGSATSIPTIVTDEYGRITSITSNAVSTTYGLQGNVGTGSISGGDTLVIVGTPNQISTTISGNTIEIGFTPNITFTDFTVSGNLIYQGGGIKTTTSPTPPTGPTNGDMWYQSGTDILYRYVNDGANEYWLDLFSTPLRAILPSRDIGGGDGEVQFNDNGTFGANAHFVFDKTTGTLQVDRFRITQSQSPATPGSPGNTGEITWDGSWMYVCVAPNSWVRAGLYTW